MDFPRLGVLCERNIPQPLKDGLLAYCPTMDLVAIASVDEQVNVYRLNGQRVFGATAGDSPSEVDALQWKPNGQLLAVGWSDGNVRILSAENSKVVNQVAIDLWKDDKITLIGWGVNFTNSKLSKAQIEVSNEDLDDILGQMLRSNAPSKMLDLPKELLFFDIENSMPKLSVLPSGGRNEDVFSSRASMDALFTPLRRQDHDSVDALISGTAKGFIALSLFESFSLGCFPLSKCGAQLEGYIPTLHSSHPYSSTHNLLLSSPSKPPVLVPLDLLFVANSGSYLCLLVSKLNQLQNLLRYLDHLQGFLQTEWKGSQDLPAKFVRNIDEALEEKCHCNFQQGAYHLVATGHCFPPMKEWLVDELSDRGHKRWDKAVTAGYENIIRLTHENLIPAIERSMVILSRLKGISRFHESSVDMGLNTGHLNSVLESLDIIALMSHSILKHASRELAQFIAFSTWLAREIDIQSADILSVSHDPEESDVYVDQSKVLEYIRGALKNSRLSAFFPATNGPSKLRRSLPDQILQYQTFEKQVTSHDESEELVRDLPSLSQALANFRSHCQVVFNENSEAYRRQVRFGAPVVLNIGTDAVPLDMRTRFEGERCCTYVALRLPATPSDVYLFRIQMSIVNGVSSTHGIRLAHLHFEGGHVDDFRFADDISAMALFREDDVSYILSTGYAPKSSDSDGIIYEPWKLNTSVESVKPKTAKLKPTAIFPNQQIKSLLSRHAFEDSNFIPTKLEINGRKGRRTVTVFDKEKTEYKVFDMDAIIPGQGDGSELGQGDEMTI